ncbi:hypothetical protein DNTS_034977, partial [Danionella cerebrum]
MPLSLPFEVHLETDLGSTLLTTEYSVSRSSSSKDPADCESYCKASKGKLKINMKKYCKKDY